MRSKDHVGIWICFLFNQIDLASATEIEADFFKMPWVDQL